jgi:uncharacterized protein involved in exopolysaccharide biosynthesis
MKHPLTKILILTGLTVAIYAATVFYLDSRIPRATATIQVHPTILSRNTGDSHGRLISRHYMESEFESILSEPTLAAAATLLGIEEKNHPEAILSMKENVITASVRETDIITITAKDPDPEKAVKIANAIAEAYAQRRAFAEEDRAKRALTALDEELAAQQGLVDSHLKALNSLPAKSDDSPHPNEHITKLPLKQNSHDQAKETYAQSRNMLREMKIKQQEARVLLKRPRHPITIHERAQ